MNGHLRIWAFFFLFNAHISFAKTLPFEIKGIEGAPLANVTQRLTELLKSNTTPSEQKIRQETQEALYPYGYFQSQINIFAKKIEIQPGPLLRIKEIHLSITGMGAHDIKLSEARFRFPLHPGMPFKTPSYETAKIELLSIAEQEGYLHAHYEKSKVYIDLQENTALIELNLNTGRRYFFGSVTFEKQPYLSDDFLARFVSFDSQTPYSSEAVEKLTTDLSKSGYFKSVDITPEESENSVPLKIKLKPVDRTNYTLGVGYGTDTGPRGRAGLHLTPVNTQGDTFNAIAQGSVSQNAFQMQYLIPGKNPMREHYSINGGFTNLNYTSGSSNGVLASIADLYEYRLFQSALSLNGLHERYTYTGQPRSEENLFFPKILLTLRKISDELFSATGYNISLSAYASSKNILSTVSMAFASVDAKAAYTLEKTRTRLYAHGIQGFLGIGDIYQLPLSLAQLLGGAENMKAYSFNSIGPGKVLTYAGLELQQETFQNWYLVGFYDAGRVYKPTLASFQQDLGLGVMWRSPVGPIKVLLAQPTGASWNGRGLRIVINMGPDL
jgi:translocation and assembly module TamA